MPMQRPLSPFMFPTWYRFQITSALSILHRLTGIALAVGSILLTWWLVAVAAGGELFAVTHAFIRSPVGFAMGFGTSRGMPAMASSCGVPIAAAISSLPSPWC